MIPSRPFLWFSTRKALEAASLLGDRQATKEIERMSDNMRNFAWCLIIVAGVVAVSIVGEQTIDRYHASTVVQDTAAAEINFRLTSQRMNAAAYLREVWVKSCRVTPDQAEVLVPEDMSGISTPPPMPRKN